MKAPDRSRIFKLKRVQHDWQLTERKSHGITLKFHACAKCTPAHLLAYEMEVYNRSAFHGEAEYEARSKRR